MNRMFSAGIAVIGVITLASSAATAQTPRALASAAKTNADKANVTKALPTGTTKVAVLNVGVVFQKYERAAAMKTETAYEMKQFQDEAVELTQNLKLWQAALQKDDLAPGKKEKLEEKLIDGRRRLEDLERQARTKLGKTQEAGVVMLWRDIREAVKTYSATHGIDLVIAYGEVKEQADTFPGITRKMQALDHGAAFPFMMNPGVDISEAIVDVLNKQYRATK